MVESIKSMSSHLFFWLLNQLGPDALPVFGAQVFSGDLALGELLNRRSDGDRGRFFARHPITDACRAHAKKCGKRSLTTS